jgi:hypothetical protein
MANNPLEGKANRTSLRTSPQYNYGSLQIAKESTIEIEIEIDREVYPLKKGNNGSIELKTPHHIVTQRPRRDSEWCTYTDTGSKLIPRRELFGRKVRKNCPVYGTILRVSL